jgi:hypothetical protein
MNFVNKIIGDLIYMWKGQNCEKDLEDGMSDRDLIKKYGEYTAMKVKESLSK